MLCTFPSGSCNSIPPGMQRFNNAICCSEKTPATPACKISLFSDDTETLTRTDAQGCCVVSRRMLHLPPHFHADLAACTAGTAASLEICAKARACTRTCNGTCIMLMNTCRRHTYHCRCVDPSACSCIWHANMKAL